MTLPVRVPPPTMPALEGVEYWYDWKAADAAASFFPSHLRLTTGEWAGRPFILSPWEEDDIIRPMFGWKRPDGTRRYRRVYVWIPRKNGKTELAAGIAIILLVGDAEEGGQVFSIATDKNQASIVFDKATSMVGWSPELEKHLTCLKPSIYCPSLNAAFRPLSGRPKGKHGLNMSGMVGDEIHEWTSGDLYQFVHQSSAARRQPLEFLISTAGEREGFGWETWQYCQRLIAGDVVDDETLVVIYGADPAKDAADPEYWKQLETHKAANPNFGISVKAEYLAAECRKAIQLPRLENDFKRYHLNLWVEQATRWLPMDYWQDCGTPHAWRPTLQAAREALETDKPIPEAARPMLVPDAKNERWKALPGLMKGRRCFGGIDLSSTNDITCTVWLFEPLEEGGIYTVVPRFYIPERNIKQRVERDKVPYDVWRRAGALTATPGNAVDYDYLKRDVFADAQIYRVEGIAVDRWNATQTVQDLNTQGLEAKLFGQGFASMSAPSKELEKLLLSGRLDHGGHPVLTSHARNAAVEKDAADNIKPSKKLSTERIDGIVGTVMALGASMLAEKPKDLTGFLANPVRA